MRLFGRLLGRTETRPPFPPDGLMFMGETEERAVRTGDELLSLVEGRFDPKGLVLDIGCGYGRLAYALERSGFEGDYLGIDVKKKSIDWLTENFTAAARRYRFMHVDVRNDRYNPGGSVSGGTFRLPGLSRPPALVLVLSVFTHMYESDVRRYLHEIARVSDARTLVYVTFFLLNDEQRRLEVEGRPKWTFPHALSGHCRVHSLDSPLHVVGYEEDWVMSAIDDAGLRLEEKVYGWWSGRRPRPLLGQDSLLLGLRQPLHR